MHCFLSALYYSLGNAAPHPPCLWETGQTYGGENAGVNGSSGEDRKAGTGAGRV